MLAEQNLMVGVKPVALTPPNSFRTDRLYTEEVDLLYKKHLPLLKAIYSAFRKAPPGGGLRLKVSTTAPTPARAPKSLPSSYTATPKPPHPKMHALN